jgi:hypothetical protein
MDKFQFYKSLYDRELNRRHYLDSAINLPITVLTILFAANSYLIGIEDGLSHSCWATIILPLLFLSFSISIFYLIRSYNNFLKGFNYKNFGYSAKIRDYEINEIVKYNAQVNEDDQLIFEDVIINRLTEYTDSHIKFNDKRSLDLHYAKNYIILTLILTLVKFLFITSKYIAI